MVGELKVTVKVMVTETNKPPDVPLFICLLRHSIPEDNVRDWMFEIHCEEPPTALVIAIGLE